MCLQEDRHVVISCLHSPDDLHSKFDPCPPCFFAVYDGHNGDLAAEVAKSKVMFNFEHARSERNVSCSRFNVLVLYLLLGKKFHLARHSARAPFLATSCSYPSTSRF